MKTILVPTDFSAAAEAATGVAASIAIKSEARLVLLHAVELPSSGSFNVEGEVLTTDNWNEKLFSMKLIEGAKQKLERLSFDLNKRGAKTAHQLRLGSPFISIREIIARETVDLIVMGTAGHSKITEMIIGSNTEKVVRHAKCPVLTVHQAPKRAEFKNTPYNFQSDVKVRKDMQAFAKKVNLKNYTINTFNHYREEEGIIQFAQDIGADLIALSTHGRTGFAHVLAGSIAEDIANHSVLPVLTYVTKKVLQRPSDALRPAKQARV